MTRMEAGGDEGAKLEIGLVSNYHIPILPEDRGPLVNVGSSRHPVRPLDGVAIWLSVSTARYGLALALVCEGREDANGWTAPG